MAPYNHVTVTTPLLEPEILNPKAVDSEIIKRTITTKDEVCTTSKEVTPSESQDKVDTKTEPKIKGYKGIFGEYQTELVWHNIIPLTLLNFVTVLGCFYFPYTEAWRSVIWGNLIF